METEAMMKKTLIATATAGLIAAGAMFATTGTASADGVYFNGPGWSVGIGDSGWRHYRPQRACEPIFKTVRWWDAWGRPHFKQVVVGRDCGRDYGPRDGWGDRQDRWDQRQYRHYRH
jgi:hypothetical protein